MNIYIIVKWGLITAAISFTYFTLFIHDENVKNISISIYINLLSHYCIFKITESLLYIFDMTIWSIIVNRFNISTLSKYCIHVYVIYLSKPVSLCFWQRFLMNTVTIKTISVYILCNYRNRYCMYLTRLSKPLLNIWQNCLYI